jgi:hypothetical protein
MAKHLPELARLIQRNYIKEKDKFKIKRKPKTLICKWSTLSKDESGVNNFRIRADPNPNHANIEKSFFISKQMWII